MTDQQIATQKPQQAIVALRDDLTRMAPQFAFALPKHISVDRFIRIVMTAVQNNAALLRCTRQSFFNACMRAAQDGLLPDGREGAIVPYGENEEGRSRSDVAQWMPMIQGIRKKVRNAGVLVDWTVQVVQEGDEFEYQLGDNPFIRHKPSPTGGRTRPVLYAYSIATYPDGTKSREVMNIDQIKDIQSLSKAKKGPWSNPIFYPEMCRKTVARLHSKQLPMSTDLDALFQRDEEAVLNSAPERPRIEAPASVQAALDHFAAEDDHQIVHQQADNGQQAAPSAAGAAEDAKATPIDIQAAYDRGIAARAANMSRKAVPGEYRGPDQSKLAIAWDRGWAGEPMPS